MPQTETKMPTTANLAINGFGLLKVIKWVYNNYVQKNS
jgi:hypothetical protein